MRIDELTITNFKGFAAKTLDLRRPRGQRRPGSFHVLVGENGSGKTSALEALAVALGVWQVAKPSAGWRAIRASEARLKLTKYRDTVRFDPLPDPTITAVGAIGNEALTWTRKNEGHGTRTTNNGARDAIDAVHRLLAAARESADVTLPLLAAYGAGRAWLPARERFEGFHRGSTKSVSRFDAYFYCLEGRIRQDDLNRWFLGEYLEAAQRGKPRLALQCVTKAVLACLPGATRVRFDFDRKELVVKLAGEERPYSSLSDGQRATLALVADLASKASTLNPHLGVAAARKSPGVVLIDELDLHLHPTWQREIVDRLKSVFPALQFIASTHSPFIIQSLEPGELLRLEGDTPPGDAYAGQSIEDIAEVVQGIAEPQRSKRAQDLGNAAAEYFALKHKAKGRRTPAVARAEKAYRAASKPFSGDPAAAALLRVEALVAQR